ncbi:unnamed protein product [Lepidochelys olivacea]
MGEEETEVWQPCQLYCLTDRLAWPEANGPGIGLVSPLCQNERRFLAVCALLPWLLGKSPPGRPSPTGRRNLPGQKGGFYVPAAQIRQDCGIWCLSALQTTDPCL